MNSVDINAKGPHPVDLHVGAAMRVRRKFLGLSQTNLANALDMTFQQVQKYERGANRVSASVLFKISQILKWPIEKFFEGIDEREKFAPFYTPDSERNVHDFLMTSEGIALAEAFPKIIRPAQRRKILDLVATLAETEGE